MMYYMVRPLTAATHALTTEKTLWSSWIMDCMLLDSALGDVGRAGYFITMTDEQLQKADAAFFPS